MSDLNNHLTGCRILAALNGLELFGHERGNIEVFKILREMGAEVMVGVNAAEGGGAVAAHLKELGFATFPLPFSNQWSWQWLKKQPWSVGEKVKAIVQCSWTFHRIEREFRPSHFHLGSSLAYSYLALALHISRTPLIYRMGDCPPTDSQFNLRIWRMAMQRAAHVVSISEYVRKAAMRACSTYISVIHSLAPTRKSEDSADINVSLPDQVTYLVYVGSVAEHKGLIPLAEAFSLLSKDYPSLHLDIIGGSQYDAPFLAKFSQLLRSRGVADRVHLLGQIEDPSRYYRRAAIHVAPSICEEALGNVVLEAKREATPSVVFPSGGLPEMVRHQVDGYVCREKSVDALEEGLRWMLSDADRLLRMGVEAKTDSEIRFGRERFAREWANVYRRN